MKALLQCGSNFEETEKTVPVDVYEIPEQFESADEVCEYLVNHGEIAETTSNFILSLQHSKILLCITENFNDTTYENLNFCLSIA